MAENQYTEGIFYYLATFDEPEASDGAWWAKLEDAVKFWNEDHNTSYDPHETVQVYIQVINGELVAGCGCIWVLDPMQVRLQPSPGVYEFLAIVPDGTGGKPMTRQKRLQWAINGPIAKHIKECPNAIENASREFHFTKPYVTPEAKLITPNFAVERLLDEDVVIIAYEERD